MSLPEQLRDYVNAAFAGLWVQTQEPDEAESEIRQSATVHKWRVAVWDVAQGLRIGGQPGSPDPNAGDPLAALRALSGMADPEATTILLLHNFHRFLTSPEVVQTT